MPRPARANVPYARYEDPQEVRDIAAREFYRRDNIPARPLGYATSLIRSSPKSVTYDDMALVDPAAAGGSAVIHLPAIAPDDISKGLSVLQVSSTGNVTIYPRPGQTINGAASTTLTQQWALKVFVAYKPNEWFMYSESPVSTGVTTRRTPFWTWNGADLTQFGAIAKHANPTASASVVSSAGVNWVQLSVSANYSSGAYDRNHQAVLPISVSPPSADYLCVATCHVSTLPAGSRFDAGFVLRWRTGTPASGAGYAIHRQNSSGGIELKRWNDAIGGGAYGTETLLRTYAQQDVNDQTTDIFTVGAQVSAGTELLCQHEGITLGHLETAGTFITAGQPGLLAGIGSGGSGTVTAVVRFRNIRCYELPQDAI